MDSGLGLGRIPTGKFECFRFEKKQQNKIGTSDKKKKKKRENNGNFVNNR